MQDRRRVLKTLGSIPLVAMSSSVGATIKSTGNSVSVSLSDGRPVDGYFVEPKSTPTGGIVLIHEGRGLVEWMKENTRNFANEGFLALAVDLYEGEVARSSSHAQKLRKKVRRKRATETLVKWIDWLRDHSGSNGRIGTVGWCYGGGWALDAAIATPVQATVIYYGDCVRSSKKTKRLEGPVMGHFATRDEWITAQKVRKFEKSMIKSKKYYENYWYEASHAFANHNYSVYDHENSQLAWSRTLEFFHRHL